MQGGSLTTLEHILLSLAPLSQSGHRLRHTHLLERPHLCAPRHVKDGHGPKTLVRTCLQRLVAAYQDIRVLRRSASVRLSHNVSDVLAVSHHDNISYCLDY